MSLLRVPGVTAVLVEFVLANLSARKTLQCEFKRIIFFSRDDIPKSRTVITLCSSFLMDKLSLNISFAWRFCFLNF